MGIHSRTVAAGAVKAAALGGGLLEAAASPILIFFLFTGVPSCTDPLLSLVSGDAHRLPHGP